MTEEMIEIKIPTDRSALSVLGNSSNTRDIQWGDEYNKDGYIYRDGARLRKWFSNRHGWNHLWLPIEDQPARLEAVYHKLLLRSEIRWAKIKVILQQVVDSGETSNFHGKQVACAHAAVTHDSTPGWWVYHAYPSTFSGSLGYTNNWCDEPVEKINQELGQQLYKLEFMRFHFLGGIKLILHEAIEKYIRKNMPLPKYQVEDDKYDIVLNGRSYVYRAHLNQYGGVEIEKVFWPGDRVYTASINHE